MKRALVLFTFAVGAPAAAGSEWLIDVSYSNPNGHIGKPGDRAFVDIWARIDEPYYAFAGATFDLLTDDAFGLWSDIHWELIAPGNSGGTALGGSVFDIAGGQLHDPAAGLFADTSNPIIVWHGTFTTPHIEFMLVNLETVTRAFDVYIDEDLNGDGYADGRTESVVDSLGEGRGGIAIVPPAPGAGTLLAVASLGLVRRRRGGASPARPRTQAMCIPFPSAAAPLAVSGLALSGRRRRD